MTTPRPDADPYRGTQITPRTLLLRRRLGLPAAGRRTWNRILRHRRIRLRRRVLVAIRLVANGLVVERLVPNKGPLSRAVPWSSS
ncbi:hypothetical protein SMICM17S_05156 [Streptomyces microflavus]